MTVYKTEYIGREEINGIKIVTKKDYSREDTDEDAQIYDLAIKVFQKIYKDIPEDIWETGWGGIYDDSTIINLSNFKEETFLRMLDYEKDETDEERTKNIEEIKVEYYKVKPLIDKLLAEGWQRIQD